MNKWTVLLRQIAKDWQLSYAQKKKLFEVAFEVSVFFLAALSSSRSVVVCPSVRPSVTFVKK